MKNPYTIWFYKDQTKNIGKSLLVEEKVRNLFWMLQKENLLKKQESLIHVLLANWIRILRCLQVSFLLISFGTKETYVIPQYYFSVDATGVEIVTSDEHLAYQWLEYSQAIEMLKWESDQIALYELQERLLRP